MKIKLLDGATATNSPPTAGDITAGFSLRSVSNGLPPRSGLNTCALTLKSTAGSGTMDVTVKIWLWSNTLEDWSPAGTGATAANRGLMNEGNAIDEVVADGLHHTELIEGVTHYEAIYAEVTAINGTATAVDLWLHSRSS